jgi:hypothetical protein
VGRPKERGVTVKEFEGSEYICSIYYEASLQSRCFRICAHGRSYKVILREAVREEQDGLS